MNTLTQQQINQYQWQSAHGVARPINPNEAIDFLSGGQMYTPQPYVDFFLWAEDIDVFTNAPDGTYSGEAFELEYQGLYESGWFKISELVYRNYITNPIGLLVEDTRLFLRLKPSHLPAVLTTQPGEEWKDRYKCYINEGGKLTEVHETNVDFLTKKQWYVLEWHLNTPPAEQEAETVVKDASYYEILSNVPGKQQEGINIALLKIWGEVEKWYGDPKKQESGRELLLRLQKEFNINFADRKPNHFETIDSLQSTLTQKDQSIAELERERKSRDIRIEYLEDRLNKISNYAENITGEGFKQLRIKLNFTLRQIEDATGISNSYLSQLENGKVTSPSHNTVIRLIDFLIFNKSVARSEFQLGNLNPPQH